MNAALRNEIRQRAGNCCEYCRLPQAHTTLPHEVDHIRSQKHNGPTTLANLCWACARCNDFKGSDVSGYPPNSDEPVRLFHPRNDHWNEHFAWSGATLIGKTDIGQATIEVLRINLDERVQHRRLLIMAGSFRP